MENQPAKRREVKGSIDRISELPNPILHNILSFLSQKEAVPTCVLSEYWRYIGSTRPIIDFCVNCNKCRQSRPGGEKRYCQSCFRGNGKTFLSALDKTFQRYHDQKLFIQEFRLCMLNVDPESFSVLEKWVPLLITPNMALDTFDINFGYTIIASVYFDVSSVVFQVKSLKKLYLERCRLNQFDFTDMCRLNQFDFTDMVTQLNRLQTLSFNCVLISDETLEKIMSSCHSIENVSLTWFMGLRTIKMVNKHPNLKHFEFTYCPKVDNYCQGVEIDAPTLETIKIVQCPNWYLHKKYLHSLKSLYLNGLHLSTEFLENFSSNFPCLEVFYIRSCIHFDEFHLSSRSIKHLTISCLDMSTKATINVPNILYFKISGNFPPSKISITTTSIEWKSLVEMRFCEDSGYDVLPWFFKLDKLLRALSQSRISLYASHDRLPDHKIVGGFNEPIVVEHLCLGLQAYYAWSFPSFPYFLNGLFHICRPSYIDVRYISKSAVIDFLCKVLVQEREEREYHWQHDLEDVEMDFWDQKARKWNPISFEEFRLLKKEKIRFRLKWETRQASLIIS